MIFLMVLAACALHDEKTSFSRVDVGEREVVWTVDVAVAGLEKVMKLPAPPLDLSDRDLQGMKADVADYLVRCLSVEINGAAVKGEPGRLEPVMEAFIASGEPVIAHARQEFRFRSEGKIRSLRLKGALFSTVADLHHAFVTVTWGGHSHAWSRYGPFDVEVTPASMSPTIWNLGVEFVRWGMVHIFVGYDHIAFLIALILGACRFKDMVKIVTSFTLAHSLTLFLAARDVIRLPSIVTESLIAASIVYVAVENYTLKDAGRRWILTFGFGLVHGLGFSEVLREKLADAQGILWPVVAFNLGVEFGQIAILLVAFPLIALLRRAPDEESAVRRQKRLAWIGSTPIFLLGLGWLIERVFSLEFMPL